ncbi:MAG: DUF4384 domain-containing protein [Candidatus Obscuribacter sp.]|nr:DUF4384 domain-containing protein [Candidatus Obscuribacter sp.]
MKDQDYFMLQLKNDGNKEVYVNVLDLQQNGLIAPVFPDPKFKLLVDDNKVKADGQWHQVPLPYIFKVSPPFGTEMLKVIATTEAVKFDPVYSEETLRSENNRKRLDPLVQVLIMVKGGLRTQANLDPGKWATAEVRLTTVRR